MKKITLLSFILFFTHAAFAQSVIISKAKIEFERKVNVWASLSGRFAERIKSSSPQYRSSFFNFISDGSTAIYKPSKSTETQSGFFSRSAASDNIVYSDYKKDISISKKNVYEKTFLIEDSLRNAKWKITNDFREIAGFNCRRATTIIMDSVFVVAFYTNQIMIPGGPESFNGLPGMILGLDINRLHTTWYATKVQVNEVDVNSIAPPAPGKAEKITGNKLTKLLRDLFSDWNRSGDSNIWSVMI